MSGSVSQYSNDLTTVFLAAYVYARSLNLAADGKDIWICDIDQTLLSNLPYFSQHRFGAEPIDGAKLFEWFREGKSPALNEALELYTSLSTDLGVKIVFLSARPEDKDMRNATEMNLKKVGYGTWEKLILRDASYSKNTTIEYKSNERKKLEESGYRIVGNIGDQWSDLLGNNPGRRTFKMRNPRYNKP